ncbi:spore germination protein GerPE [Bacillus sp. IITD106]|nr:spore germination protein GerPE [Bacillus sp. IITD106]
MWGRNSVVQHILVYSILSNGVLEIGDTVQLRPYTQALAVQRQQEIYFGKEANYYPRIFSEPIPMPTFPISPPYIRKYHEKPNICVGRIWIKGVSTSGVVHIGNTENVHAEARIDHIRQLSGQAIRPRTKVEVRRD